MYVSLVQERNVPGKTVFFRKRLMFVEEDAVTDGDEKRVPIRRRSSIFCKKLDVIWCRASVSTSRSRWKFRSKDSGAGEWTSEPILNSYRKSKKYAAVF
jgi:hypothetical protein